MIRPMIRSMIGTGGDVAIQRIFIDNDDTAGAFYSLATPIVNTGDFTAGTKAILPLDATNYTLLGQTASSLNYLKILSTGFASISIDGDVVTSTVAATKDSKLRLYDVELDGDDFKFLEDGVIIDTVTDAVAAAKTFTINALATSNGLDIFNGVMADPIFNNNGTTTSWNLDEADADIEYSNENTFGADIWIDPPNDIQAGWTDDGGGFYTHTGGTSELQIDTGSPLTASTAYKVNITVAGAGEVIVQLGGAPVDGDNRRSSIAAGTHSFVLTTNSTITFNAVRIISSTECTVSAISMDTIEGNVLTYENQALDKRELFTLVDSDWIGELMPPLTAQAGVVVNNINVTGATSAFNFITVDSTYVTALEVYQVTVTNKTTSDPFSIRFSGFNITEDGVYFFTPTGTNFTLQAGSLGFNESFDIEVKRLLEVA